MFNPLRWFHRTFCTKKTSALQFESLRIFMRCLGYGDYSNGRFHGYGIKGCRVIRYSTAVRLHNNGVWRNLDGNRSYADFNSAMIIPTDALMRAIKQRVIYKCKQQGCQRRKTFVIRTQSHVVHFANRGYAKAVGLI